jgi:hypothetical protein
VSDIASTLAQASVSATAEFIGRRARGNLGGLVSLNAGDNITGFEAYGHDGSNFINAGQILFGAAQAPTAGVVSGAMVARIRDTTGTARTLLQLFAQPAGVVNAILGDAAATVGFYGSAGVVRAAHPALLADVITILTNLNLCAP